MVTPCVCGEQGARGLPAWEGGDIREVGEGLLNNPMVFLGWMSCQDSRCTKATVTMKLGPCYLLGRSQNWATEGGLGYLPCSCVLPLPLPPVAQKVVTLRKQQQLLAACKSLPSSPSHSAASTPVAGQVSQGFRVHRGAGRMQRRGW